MATPRTSRTQNRGNQESRSFDSTPPPPIAIVGMSMRIPGGIQDPDAFWDLLINKKDARSPIPEDRFNVAGFYSPHQKAGSINMTEGYFLSDIDLSQMDAGFFSMSQAEIERLDPQQRLLLEVVYETFESAGEANWRGKDIGCYVGTFAEDWYDLHAKDSQDFGMYRITGSGDFVLANRISYEYDLRGPRSAAPIY
jgi:acyl transferase domain-containing protein